MSQNKRKPKKRRGNKAKIYHKVKDRLFRFLFEKDKGALLQLYNALNGTDYQDITGMEIVTNESAIYVTMNNDVAFIFAGILSLYEHQSTMNQNMPVRFLLYLAEEYQKVIEKAEISLYGTRRIMLPAPKCIVFYNGEKDAGKDAEEAWEMCLSDAFTGGDSEMAPSADVEVRVHMLNINYGHNKELMKQCPLLEEYSHFVAVTREYLAKGMEREKAYGGAIDYCIEHNILRDILKENRAEVLGMVLREFDVEKYERTIREEGGLNMLFLLVHKGLLSVCDAAKQASMTEQDFCAAMKERTML